MKQDSKPPQFIVRVHLELQKKLKIASEKEARSLSAQAMILLDQGASHLEKNLAKVHTTGKGAA